MVTQRKAFTLVELLIVISIIGVLMGLLIPAVQSVKEAMKRTTCINNQKQLATAVLQYQNSFRRFPGYVNSVGQDNLPASWAVMLFPYLDRADLWAEWAHKRAIGGNLGMNESDPNFHHEAHLDVLICPTNPPPVKTSSMWSYAVNGGFAGDVKNLDPYDTDPMIGPTKDEHIFNGVFFNHWSTGGFNSTMVICGSDYLVEHDGVATTIMLTENVQQYKPPVALPNPVGRWTPGPVGWRTLYFDPNSENDIVRSRSARAVVWFDADRTPNPMAAGGFDYHVGRKINFELDWPFQDPTPPNMPPILEPDHSRPSSFHPQGVVMTFCDGHIKFVKQTIEYNIYKQLMTSYGLKAGPTPDGAGYDTVNLPLSETEF